MDFAELESDITRAYTEGVTMDEAERLAGKFLVAQMQISEQLRLADLDTRMRKSGLKAVKAAVYVATCSKSDKKPTEAQLEHTINTDSTVAGEQDAFDTAESSKESLERYYNICREAHVYFRGIAKGRFE